jgi:hypothetical protein
MAKAMTARTILACGVLLLGLGASGPAHGQTRSALASATRLKCVFNVMSIGTWTKKGEALVESKKANLVLQYNSIDTSEGTAEVIGWTGGNFFITVRLVLTSLHLMTTADAGPVYLTTVFDRPTRPGKYKAVHSRHEFTDVSLPGFTSRPEQYVGECEIPQ